MLATFLLAVSILSADPRVNLLMGDPRQETSIHPMQTLSPLTDGEQKQKTTGKEGSPGGCLGGSVG